MSLIGLPTPSEKALAGRVVLISGAHGGLGTAAALACARAGATLVLLGRKPPKLNRVYDAVAAVGPEPLLYPLDLEGAAPDDYAELADRLHAELGAIGRPAALRGRVPWVDAFGAHRSSGLRPGGACQPDCALVADPGLPAAAKAKRRRGAGIRPGRSGAGGAGLLGRLRRRPAWRARTGRHAAPGIGWFGGAGGRLQPGPMRTALRVKAYAEDEDQDAVDPERYAQACVALLSAAGVSHRGSVWNPPA